MHIDPKAEIGQILFNATALAYARGLNDVAEQIDALATKLSAHPVVAGLTHLRLVPKP